MPVPMSMSMTTSCPPTSIEPALQDPDDPTGLSITATGSGPPPVHYVSRAPEVHDVDDGARAQAKMKQARRKAELNRGGGGVDDSAGNWDEESGGDTISKSFSDRRASGQQQRGSSRQHRRQGTGGFGLRWFQRPKVVS